MMLAIATGLLMVVTGWAQYRNGLFSSVAMLIKVFLAGLVAFGFWEPIADMMEPSFVNTAMAGCEDFMAMVALFAIALVALRVATNYLAPEMIDEHGTVQHLGAGVVGLVTGYFVAGFLICALQTLPLDVRFLDFQPREANEMPTRSIFPGDRVWLAMMRNAGMSAFSWKEDPVSENGQSLTFDRAGTFELRYLRHRRSTDARPPMPYQGEFEREINKQKPREVK